MKVFWMVVGVAALVAALLAVVSAFWSYSWNLAIAPTFGFGTLDVWQSLLMIVSLTIVGSMFKTNIDISKRR